MKILKTEIEKDIKKKKKENISCAHQQEEFILEEWLSYQKQSPDLMTLQYRWAEQTWLYTKHTCKWIMDLNIRCDTIKLLEEKLGGALPFRGSGKDFVNWTSMKQNKTITTKKAFLKNFYSKGNWNQVKKPSTKFKEIFDSCTSERWLVFRLNKKGKNLNTKETNRSSFK